MHHGSCLCGAVCFAITGDLPAPEACHYVQCRKQIGHLLASTDIPGDALTVTGAEHVRWHQSSETIHRGFCGTCGSTLFRDPLHRDWTAAAMGAFDGAADTLLKGHIFVGSKGDYCDLADGSSHHTG